MTSEQPHPEKLPADRSASPDGHTGNAAAKIKPTPNTASEPGASVPANSLTPEEQMALFEKELKENDWGHQPC